MGLFLLREALFLRTKYGYEASGFASINAPLTAERALKTAG
jgi:hypothetical protein